MISLVLVVWALVSTGLGFCLYARAGLGRLKSWLVAGLVFCFPMLGEIYLALAFYGHCTVFGGVTKLEPTEAGSIITTSPYFDPYRVLEHPYIDHVTFDAKDISGNDEGIQWRTKTADKAICLMSQNLNWYAGVKNGAGTLVRKTYSSGYCYDVTLLSISPEIELRVLERVEHQRYSALLPVNVQERKYQVFSIPQVRILSEYTTLRMSVGWLFRKVLPYMKPYTCPSASGANWSGDFPYESGHYEFLEKAIIAGEAQ